MNIFWSGCARHGRHWESPDARFRQVKHTHALCVDGNYEIIVFKTTFEHQAEAEEVVS